MIEAGLEGVEIRFGGRRCIPRMKKQLSVGCVLCVLLLHVGSRSFHARVIEYIILDYRIVLACFLPASCLLLACLIRDLGLRMRRCTAIHAAARAWHKLNPDVSENK